MPEPKPPPMDLREWQELCRQQEEAQAKAAAEKQKKRHWRELSPAQQRLTPAELRVLRRWDNIAAIPSVIAGVGLPLTFAFGLLWIPGLPNALLSYVYRPVPAQITMFEPTTCSKSVGGHRGRGIHYTYTYGGREYSSSRVLPPPLSNDYLDNCGAKLWRALGEHRDPVTGHALTTAYVNPVIPTMAVLQRGIPVNFMGMWGLFQLACTAVTLWSWRVDRILTARGKGRLPAPPPSL